jgi:cysteine-S-conjugate beta-lyase
VGMNDVEAILRSLPSMALRYQAHDEAARTLAKWADTQPEFVQVLHPAIPGSPGHLHWKRLCVNAVGGAAGLFSVMLDGRFGRDQADAFCDALRLFKLGYSWGGPMSLVVPYELDHMRTNWPAHLEKGTLVRFSVGLEAVQDLQGDIEQALRVLR